MKIQPTAAHTAPTTEKGALLALLSVESIDIGGLGVVNGCGGLMSEGNGI